ncbi:Lin1244/Lin1753 domain-containing protein [Chryseobacterium defluvii]|uniref:Putative phage protein (TIGR02220 family) n=1 Tax=Chryseobacterium defluvii TaxID=160396 RepID=A0A495SNX1_9FLAO|nr:Lin1244/Lin1753 domain-containing protein [Chryseobacterium defluvii]RKT01064.1 putative phage protein (TIGR02220 family) [Chryseobacterium defluvii]
MARPLKIGLDYFPLNTNIDSDDKIQLVESEFGSKGFAVIIKLYCKIYADKGYYYDWTEKEKLLFAKRTGESVGLVDEIVKRSVKWGLFEESVFNQFQILTSAAIQSRFLEAVNRRKNIEMFSEILLIDINDHENGINVNINSINDNNSTQSKVKEIKEKKNKGVVPPSGESSPPKNPKDQKPKSEGEEKGSPPEEPKEPIADKIDFAKLLQLINKETGRGFQVINENVRKKFRARLKEGYSKETILKAIKTAPQSEYHKGNGCQYLTPEFFSRSDTLDKYGNEASATSPKTEDPKEQPKILGPWAS